MTVNDKTLAQQRREERKENQNLVGGLLLVPLRTLRLKRLQGASGEIMGYAVSPVSPSSL